MDDKSEHYVDAGLALVQLGRWIQRTYPKVDNEGSQHEEDKILAKLLPGDGIYVDIGASDPKECSNTWALYKLGWRGLLIEPLPDCWPSLMLHRPEDYLAPVASSDQDGFATLHRCRSVSSLNPEWRDDNDGTIPVMTERLSTTLKRYGAVDWTQTRLCSLDVEGWEKQVLLGIDWATFRPEVFVVEWAGQDGQDLSAEWLPILMANGYQEVHRNRLNLILKCNDWL